MAELSLLNAKFRALERGDLGLVKATLLVWIHEESRAEQETLRFFQQQLGWYLWKASDGHKTMRTFLWLRSSHFLLFLLVVLGEEKWE